MARRRRRLSSALAVLVGAGAALFTVGADVHHSVDVQPAASTSAAPVAACCAEVLALPAAWTPERTIVADGPMPADIQLLAAARLRVVDNPKLLPVGKAPETGLQVRTILTARSISAIFPEIQNIGGVRPDALRWHPNGLALDVMIPNPSSAAGIALGDAIVTYVLSNAARLGIQDAIWRGTYYTPSGPSGSGYGHYDHVHVTTTGGGYPTGSEVYYR